MKGSLLDLLPLIVMIFIFSITLFLGWTILDKFGTASNGILNTTIINQGSNALSLFNTGTILIAFSIGIVIIISGFLLQSHPAMLIMGILFLGVLVFISAQFTNFFVLFAQQDAFSGAVTHFNLVVELMKNMPLFLLVIGIIFTIVTFSKYYYGG